MPIPILPYLVIIAPYIYDARHHANPYITILSDKHVHLIARTQSKTHTAMDTEDNAHSDPLQEADESKVYR